MDKRYEAYCLADPLFYDHPALREDFAPTFEHTRRPAPAGWKSVATGDWQHLMPEGHELPDQGWKVHVSTTPAEAREVLDLLWEHCVAARLPFKFLRSRGLLFLRNSKYADRGSSGKFATLYPADEQELEHTLKELDSVLGGRPGAYILSDLRYNTGPLYVRYGGFSPRRCLDAAGEPVPAIADPTGRLVPDRRGPSFTPPPWVTLPDFLAPHLAARGAQNVADLPYKIESALHFSNGGGVYKGTDTRTGAAVVLKEARPHAGLLGDGADAVARLERERDVLRLAAGTGAGPEVLDWFEVGEHRFLVLEFVEGRTLNNHFSERFPLIGSDPAPEALREYTGWALGIQEKVENAVGALHARGLAFNDLHLFNIMVRPDDTVALIDFEVSTREGEANRQVLAARAFQAPLGLKGTGVDRYALACLRLALFLPLTALLPLDRSRAAALATAIRREFPDVPAAFLDEAVEAIAAAQAESERSTSANAYKSFAATQDAEENPGTSAGGTGRPGFDADTALELADWPGLRTAITAGIGKAATPEREDRLFPGDISQFAHPGAGLDLANGAAGVLYALHSVAAPIPEEYGHWLARRAETPQRDTRLGFYDGVHGIAYVLDLLGHRDAAHRLLSAALEERWQRLNPGLADGLAGIGLNLLHFARRTGDHALHAAAVEAGRLAVELLAQQDAQLRNDGNGTHSRPDAPRGHAGLLRGASGPALLFLHLYEHTADEDWLARADAALRMDLARCTASERDGSLRVDEGWRALPYLAEGSAGIGLVLRRYLRHREDPELRAAMDAIGLAARSRFYAHAGLFNGRAGLLMALADQDAVTAARARVGASGGSASPGARASGTDGPLGSPAGPGVPGASGGSVAAGRWGAAERVRGGRDALGQLRRLAWHAVDYRGTLAFPGDQLHRLSTDLATGSAGVLLALGAALHDAPVHLPFLDPPPHVGDRTAPPTGTRPAPGT